MTHIIAIGMPSMGEWIVVAVIGLLFFGKRLPEVGRSLGKGIVEFKKGLRDVESDIDSQVDEAARQAEQRRITAAAVVPAAPARFDPVTGKPLVQPEHKFDPYTGEPVGAAVEANAATADTISGGAPVAHH